MSKTTSTRLGQILLDKGLVTAEQLDIAVNEQQKRRQLLDPFDTNLGVNSSLGEILIELGFIDRLQLRRGLNWQLMVRKMAIVMSFCAPLMTVSYGAAAATGTPRPTFTTYASSSSSVAPKINPGFTNKPSSSSSSAPAVVIDDNAESSSSVDSTPEPTPISSISSNSSSRASSIKSSSSSSKASSVASSTKSSVASETFSGLDTTAPKMSDKISVDAALYDRVQLSWKDATDESGVTRYKIYRDQVQIDTLDGYQTSYVDFNVAPGKTYLYGVSAGDDAGNWSIIKSVFAQTAATATTGNGQTSSTGSVTSTSSSKAAAVTSSSSSSKAASVVSSTSSSKAPTSVASSSSSKAASSVASTSSSKASSSAASSSGVAVAGPVNFNWVAPTIRENGIALDITEVGGYELRYRKVADVTFTYVTISDAWKNYYNFPWLEGTFVFQIAAFDKNGNYSSFVDIAPH